MTPHVLVMLYDDNGMMMCRMTDYWYVDSWLKLKCWAISTVPIALSEFRSDFFVPMLIYL